MTRFTTVRWRTGAGNGTGDSPLTLARGALLAVLVGDIPGGWKVRAHLRMVPVAPSLSDVLQSFSRLRV